jgi:hypothetical protein
VFLKKKVIQMKMTKISVLVLMMLVFAVPALGITAVTEFSVDCPAELASAGTFDCSVALSATPAAGLTGLSFTVDAGAATLNTVSFGSLIDVSAPPTYGFFTLTPVTGTSILATLSFSTSATTTVQLTGVKATFDDGANLGSAALSFSAATVTIPEVEEDEEESSVPSTLIPGKVAQAVPVSEVVDPKGGDDAESAEDDKEPVIVIDPKPVLVEPVAVEPKSDDEDVDAAVAEIQASLEDEDLDIWQQISAIANALKTFFGI